MGCEAYRHVELGAEFAVNFVREHAGVAYYVHDASLTGGRK
jgi:hypothetical protein